MATFGATVHFVLLGNVLPDTRSTQLTAVFDLKGSAIRSCVRVVHSRSSSDGAGDVALTLAIQAHKSAVEAGGHTIMSLMRTQIVR